MQIRRPQATKGVGSRSGACGFGPIGSSALSGMCPDHRMVRSGSRAALQLGPVKVSLPYEYRSSAFVCLVPEAAVPTGRFCGDALVPEPKVGRRWTPVFAFIRYSTSRLVLPVPSETNKSAGVVSVLRGRDQHQHRSARIASAWCGIGTVAPRRRQRVPAPPLTIGDDGNVRTIV
jgi:hypothetical protein